ncbi:MAG: hypothetical protein COA58_14825 [Bacteroidetes bacterium]|nr:MAG: hypothetical protein COA58_14825 [Bacteroidota bacterium]
MTKSEREQFESRLKIEDQLGQDYASYQELINALELANNRRIGDKTSILLKTLNPEKTNRNWLKVAASVLIVCSLSYLFFSSNQKEQNLYDQFFTVYEETNTQLSTEKVDFNNCIALYSSKDYLKSIDCLSDQKSEGLMHFYKGMCYANLGKTDLAIEQLKLVEAQNTVKTEESNWYLTLLYLKKNELTEVQKRLNQITNNQSSNYKKTAAKQLLEQI